MKAKLQRAGITFGALLCLSCTGPRTRETVEEKPGSTLVDPTPSTRIADEVEEAKADATEKKASQPEVHVLGTCAARGNVVRFSFAHLNDLQARYDESVGGKNRYGLIAGYLRKLKADDPATLVLDAGDDYEKGALADLRSMGEATRQMVQALPIDVRTIGNHDFSYGEKAVVRDVEQSAHPVLAANVTYEKDPTLFAPYARFDVGCARVGVVGLVTKGYGPDDKPVDGAFDDVFDHDKRYEAVLRREVEAHRSEVDVMIALTHLGIGVDMQLAARVPGVDVVIGGHTEDLLQYPGYVNKIDGKKAWVMQAGHYGQTFGHGVIAVDTTTHTLRFESYGIVKVDASLPYAADVGELAAKVESESVPDAHVTIANVHGTVAQGKPMADLVWKAAHDQWNADAMILGSDLFWGSLRPGPITLQQLYDLVLVQRQPSGTSGFSSIWMADVKGSDLKKIAGALMVGPKYSFWGPSAIDDEKVYHLAIEKRALQAPKTAFRGAPDLPTGAFKGELVDVLEAYARARTAKGLTLD
ncbi:MAG TPA: metallophosphoesterase [Polyangiaceae bacterium]